MPLVFYLTLLETAFGMALIQLFIPRQALGPGFGKTISACVFFCLLPSWLGLNRLLPTNMEQTRTALWMCGGMALAAWFAYFVILNYYRKEAIQRGMILLAVLLQAAMVYLTSRILAGRFYSPGSTGAEFGPSIPQLTLSLAAGVTASSLLLGSVTMAMLIGHWYLVIPGLAIRWLKGACLVFGASIILKALASGLSLMIGAYSDPFGPEGFLDHTVIENLTLFAVRVLVGFILPAGLCVMAYKAAAIRSTQSSTGILFPAMIIVFLGEMIGNFMITGLSGLCV